MDRDGYPEQQELFTIEKWDAKDLHGLMGYVESLWHWAQYFNRHEDTYILHTGGWSGNEEIIGALMRNQMFWMFNWEQSRRGGHYIFSSMNKEE